MTAAPSPGASGPARAIGRGALAAVVTVAVVAGAVWWTTDSDDDSVRGTGTPTPSSSPTFGQTERDQRASAILRSLSVAWRRQDEPAFVAAAGADPAARRWAGEVYRNLTELRVRWMDLRYVIADPATVADTGGFTADVEIRWQVAAGAEDRSYLTAPVTVPLRFSYDGDYALSVLGVAGRADAPVPVWLAGPLDVERARGGTCIAVPDGVDLDRCEDLVHVAVRDLARVVPANDTAGRPIVVMVPATARTAATLLGQTVDDLTQIAAVTTTIDGSRSVRVPAQIVLNPAVFDDLSRGAAQLVVSHEVTHAATGATAASMDLWVAEGFADYVALHSGRIPVRRAASQILSYVRKHDAPTHLPTARQFAADRHGLGRTYEAAWLIFRMLGSYYGDDAVVAFYDEVRAGTAVETALLDTIGIDLHSLTVAWQDYLTSLAFGTY